MFSGPKTKLLCRCEGSTSDCDQNKTCEISTDGGHCFVETHANRQSRGCTNAQNCHGKLFDFDWPNVNFCCNEGDFCNAPTLNETNAAVSPSPLSSTTAWHSSVMDKNLGLGLVVGAFILALFVGLGFVYWRYFKRGRRVKCGAPEAPPPSQVVVVQAGEESVHLATRSLGNQVTGPWEVIGAGAFGRVYRATFMGRHVAVKVFDSDRKRNAEAYQMEKKIYAQLTKSSDKNILRYVGCDIVIDSNSKPRGLWIVTEFCDGGSLDDYLNRQPVENVETCVRMCAEIASGLLFLHSELKMADNVKPMIAHRDLKPSNVLLLVLSENVVRCVIGDFGYSVYYYTFPALKDEETPAENETPSIEGSGDAFRSKFGVITCRFVVGTIRYMSPEVLSSTISYTDFEKLKCSDIYSLGLIFWEIAARTKFDPLAHKIPERQLVYSHVIAGDPKIEQMRDIVCDQKIRPPINENWNNFEAMRRLSRIIQECLHEDPNSRVTACYIQKQLLTDS